LPLRLWSMVWSSFVYRWLWYEAAHCRCSPFLIVTLLWPLRIEEYWYLNAFGIVRWVTMDFLQRNSTKLGGRVSQEWCVELQEASIVKLTKAPSILHVAHPIQCWPVKFIVSLSLSMGAAYVLVCISSVPETWTAMDDFLSVTWLLKWSAIYRCFRWISELWWFHLCSKSVQIWDHTKMRNQLAYNPDYRLLPGSWFLVVILSCD
jgi:hypothetical protein